MRFDLFLVALGAAVAISGSHATSLCPRGLHAVLESPACRRLVEDATRTAIDQATIGDGVCVASLRELFASSAVVSPCSALLSPHRSRQLTPGNTTTSTNRDGYNCTVSYVDPPNGSAVSASSFLVQCEPVKQNLLWLWICLGCFGGVYALWCLIFWGCLCADAAKPRVDLYPERRRERASAKAEAKAQAKAQAKLQEKLEATAGGHPYILA